MNEFPIRLSGKIWWFEGTENKVSNISEAIFRSKDELVIEFLFEDHLYTTNLERSNDTSLSGKFFYYSGSEKVQGNISCTIYENIEGYFLHGFWIEEVYNIEWIAELINYEPQLGNNAILINKRCHRTDLKLHRVLPTFWLRFWGFFITFHPPTHPDS